MLRTAWALRALSVALVVSIGPSGKQTAAGDPYGRDPQGYAPPHRFAPGERSVEIGFRPDEQLVHLGEKLFFDVRLSATGRTACASCHDPRYSFAEPRRVSISDNGQIGRRNAPSLLDVGLLPRLMWDGKFHALERQAFGPFERGEMGIGVEQAVQRLNADPRYAHLFREALGIWPTPDSMARALAAFQRTLISRESRVDRFLITKEAAGLTSLELDGYAIFTRKAQCSACHRLFPTLPDGRKPRRPLFSDFQFYNLGVGFRYGEPADAGRFELTRQQPDWGAFRTPSLRNSAKTPPYMHDGSLATLEDVVEFYSAGGRPNPNQSPLIRPLHLDGYEKSALVAFLRAMGE
jgi:cytochrome c peroxidase